MEEYFTSYEIGKWVSKSHTSWTSVMRLFYFPLHELKNSELSFCSCAIQLVQQAIWVLQKEPASSEISLFGRMFFGWARFEVRSLYNKGIPSWPGFEPRPSVACPSLYHWTIPLPHYPIIPLFYYPAKWVMKVPYATAFCRNDSRLSIRDIRIQQVCCWMGDGSLFSTIAVLCWLIQQWFPYGWVYRWDDAAVIAPHLSLSFLSVVWYSRVRENCVFSFKVLYKHKLNSKTFALNKMSMYRHVSLTPWIIRC